MLAISPVFPWEDCVGGVKSSWNFLENIGIKNKKKFLNLSIGKNPLTNRIFIKQAGWNQSARSRIVKSVLTVLSVLRPLLLPGWVHASFMPGGLVLHLHVA